MAGPSSAVLKPKETLSSGAYRYGFPYRFYRDIFGPSRYFSTIYRHLQVQSCLADVEPLLDVADTA